MAFVASVVWTAREGMEQTLQQAVEQLVTASRQEPACLSYFAYRDPAQPGMIRILEIYTDRAGFEAHAASDHFKTWGFGQAIPALESRDVQFYETVEP
ncbi:MULTISPECIES: putative quinol monooxygenase [unclassified Mycobacterium]|uniref:putative quinol monooxygenase n=1 Tax=unclassified Mycobacterium TaxID=2642494 RepID=UPI0029C702AD|nr:MULTISPECIES: putative quinol monooxygenase [unclassified Mycobacterium]